MSKIHFSSPGKQFICGEWAILELGTKGIVAAVNKRVHAEIGDSDSISISIDDFGIKGLESDFNGSKLVFSQDIASIKDKLQFIKEAIEISLMVVLGVVGLFTASWPSFKIITLLKG